MSLVSSKAALQARLATVPGLVSVLSYPPTAAQDLPMMYLWFIASEETKTGTVVGDRWTIGARLVTRWQDFEEAEAEVDALVDTILATLRADLHLGVAGAKAPCLEAVDSEGGWETIGNVEYRAVDFDITVLDKHG